MIVRREVQKGRLTGEVQRRAGEDFGGSLEAAANDLLYGIYASRWKKLANADIHQLTTEHHILNDNRHRIGTWASCGSGEELKALEKR